MAVVAGVVFFAVRALLALFPALTAGYAIKKWSAVAALAAAAFYLLLSGAEVATQRSFFMTAVVLIAVMREGFYRRSQTQLIDSPADVRAS
jgi:competence protein ComEC